MALCHCVARLQEADDGDKHTQLIGPPADNEPDARPPRPVRVTQSRDPSGCTNPGAEPPTTQHHVCVDSCRDETRRLRHTAAFGTRTRMPKRVAQVPPDGIAPGLVAHSVGGSVGNGPPTFGAAPIPVSAGPFDARADSGSIPITGELARAWAESPWSLPTGRGRCPDNAHGHRCRRPHG
jgi:hypothetical protein